jgi:hypothetical protein
MRRALGASTLALALTALPRSRDVAAEPSRGSGCDRVDANDDAPSTKPINVPRGTKKLLRAQVVFRHGERAPLAPLDRDSEVSDAWESLVTSTSARADVPSGTSRESPRWAGLLTERGRETCRRLGRDVIRRRLIKELKLVSGDFDEAMARGEVRVRATVAPRCAASARAVARGAWPDGRDVEANVSIEVREKALETMFPKPGNACEALNVFFDGQREKELAEDDTIFARRGFETLRKLRDAMTRERPEGRPAGLSHVWDPLQCRVSHGLALPRGVSVDDVGELTRLMERRYFDAFTRADAKRLIGTSLLREIADEMTRESPVKLTLYAGHDSTIIALFAALDEPAFGSLREWPRVCSALIFETWRMNDDTIGVRAVYNGETIKLTETSRREDGMTPYVDFRALVERRSPRDFVSACKSKL